MFVNVKVPFHQKRVSHKLLRTFSRERLLCTYNKNTSSWPRVHRLNVQNFCTANSAALVLNCARTKIKHSLTCSSERVHQEVN